MIKKIISIKNLGIFEDYKSESSLSEFKRYNLIYGWNASGKTTLSKLFEALETGRHKDFPNLKYRVKVKNSTESEITEEYPYTKKIKIFNKKYIEKNIQIDEGKANSIVILGEENKKISLQIKADKESIQSLEEQSKSLNKLKDKTQKERGEKFTNVARVIGEAIGGDAKRNYRKDTAERKFKEIFFEKKVTDELLNGNEYEEHKRTCRQDIIDTLEETPIPSVLIDETSVLFSEALDRYFNKSKDLCSQVVDVVAIKRLKKNLDISKWVEEGLSLHKKHNSEKCEFCTQDISEDRFIELENFFNEATKKIKEDIDSVLEKVREIYGIVKNLVLHDKARLYKELQNDYQNAKETFDQAKEKLLKEIEELGNTLKKKKERVSEKVDIEKFSSTSDFLKNLEEVNKILIKHNDKTNNFKGKKEEAKEKIERHCLAEIYDNIEEKEKELKKTKSEIKKVSDNLKTLKESVEKNEAKISSIHKACKKINEALESFLGRKEISFEVSNGGYFLKRKGENVKNLSEGEKTAVALVYFLVSLEEKGIELST